MKPERFPASIEIGGRRIGVGEPCYFVAELSANHDGSLDRAIETLRAAAQCGADAVKLQTYTADTITIKSERPEFTIGGTGPWAGRTLHDLYQEAHTPWEWHPVLFEEAAKLGLGLFSTPFDSSAVDFLEELKVPVYKIASFELVDDGLLRKVAATRKPVILSTGMASLEEIAHAIDVLEKSGAGEIVLLHCTSSYPAPDDAMNLLNIPLLRKTTGKLVGLSDHSLGPAAPVVAVTLGACMVEKHFTLSRADGGVDSEFSLEPSELRETITNVHRAESMLGTPGFGGTPIEAASRMFRRSLYVVADVENGAELTTKNVRSIRPGFGLPPRFLDFVIGRRATQNIPRGTPLDWQHLTHGTTSESNSNEQEP